MKVSNTAVHTPTHLDQEQYLKKDADGKMVVDHTSSAAANFDAAEKADVAGAFGLLFQRMHPDDRMNAADVLNKYTTDLIQGAGYSAAAAIEAAYEYLAEQLK